MLVAQSPKVAAVSARTLIVGLTKAANTLKPPFANADRPVFTMPTTENNPLRIRTNGFTCSVASSADLATSSNPVDTVSVD